MTALRIGAVLLVVNALVFLVGINRGGDTGDIARPSWLPSVWLRAAVPLVIGAGLWLGHRWAWWLAVVVCSFEVLFTGLASLTLIPGGYFSGEGRGFRSVHFGLRFGTWLATLGFVLSKSARAALAGDLTAHRG